MNIFRGDRLKALRKAHGLTQVQLSELSGVNRPQLSCIENNLREPELYNLVKLAKALNTTTDYLCGVSDCEFIVNNA